jgi:hypothetical protein
MNEPWCTTHGGRTPQRWNSGSRPAQTGESYLALNTNNRSAGPWSGLYAALPRSHKLSPLQQHSMAAYTQSQTLQGSLNATDTVFTSCNSLLSSLAIFPHFEILNEAYEIVSLSDFVSVRASLRVLLIFIRIVMLSPWRQCLWVPRPYLLRSLWHCLAVCVPINSFVW